MHQNVKESQHKKNERHGVPPEGGYGWIIVIAYALANLIGIPTTSNFGLIFKDKFAEMKMPAADLTLIININSALSMSLGFINGPLLRHFGYRKVSVVAAILFSMGLILTSIANSVMGFIITYGMITAVGYGLSNSSFTLALTSYFRQHLNRASGVAMTLAGIGPILYPPLIQYLLDTYDFNGCMLIIGAIALHMLLAAVLLQPLKWHLINVTDLEAEFRDDKQCDFLSKCSICDPTVKLPAISTFQSIGKFSNASYIRKDGSHFQFSSDNHMADENVKRASYMSIDHDIETQSIYGFDQMLHRQPSAAILNQETIARNFSKRTLCLNPISNVGQTFGLSCSTQHCNNIGTSQSQLSPPPKPLRWFESGSVESIHLGSSAEIFKESLPQSTVNKHHRKSSLFIPLRRQSLFVQAIKKNLSTSRHDVEPEMPAAPKDAHEIAKATEDLPDGLTYLPVIPLDEESEQEDEPSCCCALVKWFVTFFELDLLCDNIYLNMMLGMSISIFAEINFAILTPFILSDLNYGAHEIPSILSVIAVADLVSRFTSPFITDHFRLSVRMSYVISLVLLIITRTGMLFTTGYLDMIIVAIGLGIAKGVRTVYMSIVVPSYIPIDRLASASGIQMFTNGLFMIILGPILGFIKDFSGSYSKCIVFLNLVTFVTVLMYTVEMTYTHYQDKKEKRQMNET